MSHPATAPGKSADFNTFLKTQTAEAHTRLEALPISQLLVNKGLTPAIYAEYLSVMRRVHADAERNLFPLLSGIVPDLDSRRKLGLLNSDLKSDFTSDSSLFQTTSPAFALGILYVLEGSTLGGRYILKNVGAQLGLTPENGASYFNGYGNATGTMWKSFMNSLANYHDIAGGDEIFRGANYGFESIYELLAESDTR